jgi:acetylornithine/N-succinyldiaminopimelate aminotransferase
MSIPNEIMRKAVMPTYGRAPVSFVRGVGSWLYTADGDAYLDFASGIAVNIFGHSHPRLVEALTSQAGQLWHTSNLYQIPQQEKLAYRLAQHAQLDQTFFCNSGAEANEAAVKIARRFQYRSGHPERIKIICAGGAFHGRTLAMLAATDKELFREGFGPMPEGFVHVPFGNLNALRDIMSDDVAAIMVEPVQGEGGARAAPEGYLDGLADAAQEFGALIIADEVQCGLGRTGKIFAFQHSSIQPDIVVLAKGLGGGIPIGAVIARADIGEAMGPGSHGSTFGGNSLSTACGNAVLDGLEEEGFMAGVQHRISLLDDVVSRLHSRFSDIILEVRGAGFLRGMKLHDDILAGDVTAALRERYLLVVPAADNVVRLLPPLTITEGEIAQVEAHFIACFDSLSASK